MNRRRTAVLASSIAVSSVLILGGCSGSDSEPAQSASAAASAMGGTMIEQVTALCEQIVADQMTVDEATALAETNGFTTRIVFEDGKPLPATRDYREDRMSFDVEAGVVTKCVAG